MYRVGICGLALATTLAACAENSASSGMPDGPSGLQPPAGGQVQVTRVRAFIRDGAPQVFVEGELGDGCNSLEPIDQDRAGQTIDLDVTYERRGEVCTMIMQYVNEWVALEGALEPGEYTVRANERSTTFELIRGADGDLRVSPDPGPPPQPPYQP